MLDRSKFKLNRRGLLKSAATIMAGGMLGRIGEAAESPTIKNVNLHSSPSTLKITDLRYAVVVKPGPSPSS